jgi:hypothetical protein
MVLATGLLIKFDADFIQITRQPMTHIFIRCLSENQAAAANNLY